MPEEVLEQDPTIVPVVSFCPRCGSKLLIVETLIENEFYRTDCIDCTPGSNKFEIKRIITEDTVI